MIIRNYLFHRVSPIKDELWAPMNPELFEKIIIHLKQKYNIVNLEETYLSDSIIEQSKPLATISFDDGYKDNIEYAAAILNKHKVTASFYVITDCIDKNIPTWTFILDYLFQNTNKLTLDFNKEGIPETLKSSTWNNRAERVNYARILKPYLKQIGNEKRISIFNSITSGFNDVELPKVMMTWDDVNELSNFGFSVGSHSVSHPLYATVDDDDFLYNELFDSAQKILEKTGKFPIAISYPIGSYNNKVIDLSKKCDYKLGIAVKQRFYNSKKDNLFEIPRMELFNESWIKSKLRINGTLETIKSIIR